MKCDVLDYGTIGDRAHLFVAVEGYPGWAVEAVVMRTDSGPVLTDLSVWPWQVTVAGPEPGTSQMGGRVFAQGEPHPESGWSELAEDVPPGGIPARLIRSINAGQLVALAQKQANAAAVVEADRADRFAASRPDLARYLRATSVASTSITGPVKRSGRRGNGIDHYLTWAVRYADKIEAGVAHPNKVLAKEHNETTNYVRDTITDARRRYGLLTKSGQGRAGGQLTAKALALIAERTQRKEAE